MIAGVALGSPAALSFDAHTVRVPPVEEIRHFPLSTSGNGRT